MVFDITGAPKILLDSLQREVVAPVGEPYRIRIPFKGSPAPTASWYNVCVQTHVSAVYLQKILLRICLTLKLPNITHIWCV